MKYLDVYAGPTAMKVLQQQGLKPEIFSAMLGASGGPKWFALFGLDCYLFGEFFANRKLPLHLIGSSAGAFRFAALTQSQPVAAIARLAHHYSRVTYSANPSSAEISDKGLAMVDTVLGSEGASEILNNPTFHPHFITAKTNGLLAFEHKLPQLMGLTKSYLMNRVKRGNLAKQYQRVIFTPKTDALQLNDPAKISTTEVLLTEANLIDALLASGSIPMLLKGVKDITGAPRGTYRDGGIIDYHFDFKVKVKGQDDALVLFPHFSGAPRAGWFDKSLKRTPLASSYDNVIMLSPTKAFVEMLPFGKIPDREDFSKLDPKTRFDYWDEVLEKSKLLAKEFSHLVDQQDISEIKPLKLI